MEIYDISDMVLKFGYRIKNALSYDKDGEIIGIVYKEMVKITQKPYNNDIREYFKKYQGLIMMPYIMAQTSTIVNSFTPSKKIANRYSI